MDGPCKCLVVDDQDMPEDWGFVCGSLEAGDQEKRDCQIPLVLHGSHVHGNLVDHENRDGMVLERRFFLVLYVYHLKVKKQTFNTHYRE